jgi:phosphohistidine phosphatase SixA
MMLLQHATLAVAVAITAPNDRLSPDSMMVELRKGGYTILWRHASTDYSTKDAPGFPDDRTQQRNLTEQGALDAGLVGQIFKRRGIPISDVLVSQMYRTRETAERAFGRFEIDTLLRSMQPSDAERALIRAVPAKGTNRVLVTHHFIIERNAPGIRPGDVAEGEAVVVRWNGETLETVALFKMADWRRLAEATPGIVLTLNSLITRTAVATPDAARPAAPRPSSSLPLAVPALLETPRNTVIAEYLRTFNAGDPERMRRFFDSSVVPNPERTMEQRLESYARLRGDLGNLTIDSAEVNGDAQVVVKVDGSTGKPATITFTLESPASSRIRGISVQYAIPSGGHHP